MSAYSFASWAAVMSVLTIVLWAINGRLHQRYQARTVYVLWAVLVFSWVMPVRPSLPPSLAAWTESVLSPKVGSLVGPTEPNGVQAGRFVGAEGVGSASLGTGSWPLLLTVILVGIWAFGAAFSVIRNLLRYRRLSQMVRRWGRSVRDQEQLAIWSQESDLMGVLTPPQMVEVPVEISPMIFGVLHPRLLLSSKSAFPSPLVLRHELAHVRRRDTLVRMVFMVITAIFWWNPLLRLAVRQARESAELACDYEALDCASVGERFDYAKALLETARVGSRVILVGASFSVERNTFQRRLQAITEAKTKKYGWLGLVPVIGAVLAIGVPFQSANAIEGVDLDSTTSLVVEEDVSGDEALKVSVDPPSVAESDCEENEGVTGGEQLVISGRGHHGQQDCQGETSSMTTGQHLNGNGHSRESGNHSSSRKGAGQA